MPSTYIKLASTTVGAGGASSISFTSIPQTYTDLVIKMSTRTTETPGASALGIQFNGASTTVSAIRLNGTGAAVSSGTFAASSGGFGRYNNVTGQSADSTASTFSNGELYFPNYTSSNFKSFSNDMVTENNGTTAYAEFDAGLWSSTSAITSIGINVYGGGGSFVQYTTATLYGVLKYAETGIGSKATGGTVTTSGGYTIHTFYSSGMFTPTASITGADVLCVAGGGGGGFYYGGGGGAGGFQTFTGQSFTSGTPYAAIVGAGGAGSNVGTNKGSNGTNSILAALTASVGGGGGASNNNINGANGGSGGGASGSGAAGTGGTGTAGQGTAGGNQPAAAPSYGSGGGGGASAAGAAGTGTAGGAGGAGTSNSYSGSAVVYAGGGGGASAGGIPGAGGNGGGGAAGVSVAQAGRPNTGGGGGGVDTNSTNNLFGGSGGSGIIIVRYTT
jgi:hypothetical protein